MHPPFYVVDHRIDHSRHLSESRQFEEKRVVRRNRPESLRLTLPASGFPFGSSLGYLPPPPLVVVKSRPFGWARLLALLRLGPFDAEIRPKAEPTQEPR